MVWSEDEDATELSLAFAVEQSLIENNLVDELRLMVFRVVLGTGKRLFGETTDKKRLQLSSSTVVGEGVAIQVYTRR